MRRKLRIDTDDLRARNPDIIIARGSAPDPRAPRPRRAATTAPRSGPAAGGPTMPEKAGRLAAGQPTPAFGDVMGGLATAGAIAAALVKRERTGEPSVVDVSLLATAMWQLSPMVIAVEAVRLLEDPAGDRAQSANPGVGTYRTTDDRFVSLILLQCDKHWDDFVERLGMPEMATDPRFADSAARAENSAECIRLMDEAFESQPLAHWKEAFDGFEGVWSPFQTLDELYDDPQVQANGYLPTMTAGNGEDVELVASPAQFDERRSRSSAPPSTASTPSRCSSTSATTGTRSPR